ncbi:Protein-export chaperone SecB [Candidatus Bealeia paramacronuclearis]|uniref:Protein-export protein SecB n=1 Tax=Candidatus Bealeia paramacronuclearis TaxID=1921001 RepID=A0ABZ2C3S4_9PROT|nr:Protein-export chaperone SecB [Candidatus Bealeia paramacronuclearis]
MAKKEKIKNGLDTTEVKETNGLHEAPESAEAALTVVGQYVKDLSFETPNAIKALFQGGDRPHFDINIEAQANHVSEKNFEVGLHVKVNCLRDKESIFILELLYAGLFTIGKDVPEEYIRPILMVECPRILFPFARSIVASTVQEGGFPPLMLTPIDFASLYQQQLARENQEVTQQTQATNA